MSNATFFGEAAGIILSLAALIYLYDAIFGTTKPDRVSWLIWTVLGGTLLATYKGSVGQDTEAIWVPYLQFVVPALVLVVSVFRGENKWHSYYGLCLAGACVSLATLWIFDSPQAALLAALASDACGAVPTIVKALKKPASESKFGWSFSLLANLVNLGAVTSWTFAVAGYPLYLLFLTLTMSIIIFWPRKPS